KRRLKQLRRDRLQQVPDGIGFECAQCVVVVRGDEDDRAGRRRGPLEYLEAVEVRHLDVEKHQIRPELRDRRDGGGSIGGLAEDLDVFLGFEQESNSLPHERRIVDDQRPDHAGTLSCSAVDVLLLPGSYGIRIVTLAPPNVECPQSRRASDPYRRCRRARVFASPTPSPPGPSRNPGPESLTRS